MINQSSRQFADQVKQIPHKIKFKHSKSRIQVDELNQVENNDFFLSRILCLHHMKTAVRYLCDVNNDNIVKYNSDYQDFIKSTKLRDVVIEKNEKGEDTNVLVEAFKLQRWAIVLIILFSLMAGAASVVIIYYQQTLAKYIITKTSDQQYKWFGIIVGAIVFRFLIFNYLMALTNNIAINVKVGLENMFMRAIFFLNSSEEELNMHRMRFLSIEALIEAIIFVPYAIVSISTIIGVAVLIFVLNNYYGFVFFGLFLTFIIFHLIILIVVYQKLRKNQEIKDEIIQQSKWVFRSLLPLIFDRIGEKIVKKIIEIKDKSLTSDRLYNISYSLSQFLSDVVTVISFVVYYGLNHDKNKDMTLQNTYLTAVYLGMLYYPFKNFVYGSFTIVRGFQQYFSMVDNFKMHINKKKMRDSHLASVPIKVHSYSDNLGECFHYTYQQKEVKTESNQGNLPSATQLQKSSSNAFKELHPEVGEAIMAYFHTSNKNQVERYVHELINSLPFDKTVAIINENQFVLPESFQQNILFYSEYNQQRFHEILKLMELDYFIPQIEALGNNHLNYRISKYYAWHECRLQLARALYNNVDYLILNKFIIIQDKKLLKNIIDYRKKQGKTTFIANNWELDAFKFADRVIFFQNQERQIGTYESLISKKDSIINTIKKQLKKEGAQTEKSEQIANLHQNFLALVTKKPPTLELRRKIYFQFFGFAHTGAFLVVILALIAPIGFKVYMSYLIGQSTKVVIYPDILAFGVVYLILVFLRGAILSFYFRLASSQLFSKIVSKHRQLCGDQILNIYKQKDDKIENDFKKIDSNLVINFELGFSVMIDNYGSLIIVAIGQPIVLAMALPLMVFTGIVNVLYNKIQRNILTLRNRYEQELKTFINHCTTRALALFKYGQYQHIQNRFNEMHRIHIMFACNEMWVLSGMRMIGEIFIIISVIIFLVIMIETQSRQTSNLAMVSYGVSLFINMNFSYRFNLKTISILEAQMLALTKCVDFFKEIRDEADQSSEKSTQVNIISEVETIEYRDINIEFGNKQCSNINLKINRGDRIAVSSDSKSLVTLPFYLLRRHVFSKDHVKGDILINGKPQSQFDIDGLFYIHYKPLLPYNGTVYDICLKWKEEVTKEECVRLLQEFFKQINMTQLFTIDDHLNTMNIGYQQILSIFRAIKFQKCKILVLISAFDYLDILTRIKIQKYLIHRQEISIIISITNNPEITHFYKRNIIFKGHKFVSDSVTKEEYEQELSFKEKEE